VRGILTIQSWVGYGHVGNAAAMFPLQRLGFEAWAVNTVQFSNHPGYGAWRGQVFTAAAVAEIVTGIAERGALGTVEAVLSGYLGDLGLGPVVLDAVAATKSANPAALWCCDPVMGDTGRGFYVRPGLPEFFRDQAMARADIVTPNQFELEFLAGHPINDLASAMAACAAIRARGPSQVLLTSLRRPGAPTDRSETLLSTAAGDWLIGTPLLPITVNGAGDALAALYLGHYLRLRDAPAALALAVSAIHAVLRATLRLGEREIQLIAAQDELRAPDPLFEVEPLLLTGLV
jgi:pyridoxine kinase